MLDIFRVRERGERDFISFRPRRNQRGIDYHHTQKENPYLRVYKLHVMYIITNRYYII